MTEPPQPGPESSAPAGEGQPAGWQPSGPPATAGTPDTRSTFARHRTLFIVLGVVGLLVIVGVILGVINITAGKTLNADSADRSIESNLHQQLVARGADRPIHVKCPSGEKVEANHTFTCTVTGLEEGGYHHISVTETDKKGHFDFQAVP